MSHKMALGERFLRRMDAGYRSTNFLKPPTAVNYDAR